VFSAIFSSMGLLHAGAGHLPHARCPCSPHYAPSCRGDKAQPVTLWSRAWRGGGLIAAAPVLSHASNLSRGTIMPSINPDRLLGDLYELRKIGAYKTGVHRPT